MSIDIGQVIIQIFAFILMLWILKKFGWKPILKMLKDRQQKIQSSFDDIDAQKEEVKKIAEDYEERLQGIETEARHKIQEGVMKGRLIAAKIQEEAQVNAREIAAKAKADIEKEIAKARSQLKNDLVNIAMSIAEKIVQSDLDEAKHKKLITEFVESAKLE